METKTPIYIIGEAQGFLDLNDTTWKITQLTVTIWKKTQMKLCTEHSCQYE